MKRAPLGRILLLLLSACILASCEEPVPVKPSPTGPVDPETEPVLRVQIPGAYGVKGGDQVLQLSRQSSILTYGKTFSYRMLDPATLTVVSLTGLPVGLDTGDKVSFQYRLSRRGVTLASEAFEDVPVLLVSDKRAWLKKDDNTFFVLDLL